MPSFEQVSWNEFLDTIPQYYDDLLERRTVALLLRPCKREFTHYVATDSDGYEYYGGHDTTVEAGIIVTTIDDEGDVHEGIFLDQILMTTQHWSHGQSDGPVCIKSFAEMLELICNIKGDRNVISDRYADCVWNLFDGDVLIVQH
jgi:hypothetical protein